MSTALLHHSPEKLFSATEFVGNALVMTHIKNGATGDSG